MEMGKYQTERQLQSVP